MARKPAQQSSEKKTALDVPVSFKTVFWVVVALTRGIIGRGRVSGHLSAAVRNPQGSRDNLQQHVEDGFWRSSWTAGGEGAGVRTFRDILLCVVVSWMPLHYIGTPPHSL